MDARHDMDCLYSKAMFACCDRHFRYRGVVGEASHGELYFA